MDFKALTCPIATTCGGCEWLDVAYPLQLAKKQQKLLELYKDVCEPTTEVLPIIGMKNTTGFRHKATTPFAKGPKGTVLSGFYKPGTHHIVPCKTCLVEDPRLRPILLHVAKTAERLGVRPYNENSQKGILRHAVVRSALYTDDILLTLVTNGEFFPKRDAFVKAFKKLKHKPTTIVQNINEKNTNAILGSKNNILFGSGFIKDRLLGATFRIGATSFYQTNPRQTEVLYKTAIKMADLQNGMHLIDAYCGCGTIGICAARKVNGLKVLGIEKGKEAVSLAKTNTFLNKLHKHCKYVCADATEFITTNPNVNADVVVLDPPRAGSTPEFLHAISMLNPEKIVYISCNPKTQVRDIAYLQNLGWKFKSIQAVDMFAHTSHVESVALLEM